MTAHHDVMLATERNADKKTNLHVGYRDGVSLKAQNLKITVVVREPRIISTF